MSKRKLSSSVSLRIISYSNVATRLQVNDISTGLLSVLLLPQLEETAKKQIPPASASYPPHLCLVASEVHFWAQFANGKSAHPVQELNDRSRFDGGQRYNVSKLLVIFIIRELAKRASENVVVNCVRFSSYLTYRSKLMYDLGQSWLLSL